MYKYFIDFLGRHRGIYGNIKNAGLYFLGSILQSVLALIAQPIYAIHMSASEFGILGYFDAIKSIFLPIFLLSMPSVYLMQYFRQDEPENKKLLFNITFYLCCLNSITIFISYLIIYYYFTYLNITIPLNPFAWFALSSLVLENIKTIVLINFRIRKKAAAYFYFSAVNAILNFCLGLLFVAYFKWGAEGRMFAPLISSLVLLPVCWIVLKKFTTVNFRFTFFLKNMKLAIPLVLASYAYVPIANIDRLFLERLNDLSELGLYNIGITIAGYVQLAYAALALAFEPDIFKSVANHNPKKLMQLAVIMFAPYLLLVILMMLFSGSIVSILTAGKYLGAEKYTNITLLSVFLMGVFYFSDKIFVALGKTKLSLYVNTVGGVSAIAIMYIAVSYFGFTGAAYGKVLVAIVMVTTSANLVIKHFKMRLAG